MPRNLPRITFVRADFDASGYYRLYLPAMTLAARGWPVVVDRPTIDDFEAADILVFQRQRKAIAVREMEKWKQRGKKIVLDLDDNFFLLEPHNPVKPLYDEEALKCQAAAAQLADAVTVTTESIKDGYAKFNPEIFVLPNSVDQDKLKAKRIVRPEVIIGWQGGWTHAEDLKTIKNSVRSVVKKTGARLVLAGYNPPGVFRSAEFRPWVPFTDDLPYLDSIRDFSIGLCPLAKTPFNECKSDIKFLEYSLLGIPTVATKIRTHADIAHGTTGLLARNQGDWEAHLLRLIADPGLREDIGSRAREHVASTRTIQRNIHLWEEVFLGL